MHGKHGFQRIEWPTGGYYVEQENLVVEMFDVIREERDKMEQPKRLDNNV